jgi:FAD/FMN-containing dehydrogenase
LAKTFSGQLLQPADLGYEEARKVHNGLVDKRPGLIAECRGVADVIDAIHLARKLNLEVAVRGGGHNVAGRASIDGGVLIDLAPMKGIRVDPQARTVWAQGGVTWAELNRETQLHGLAVTTMSRALLKMRSGRCDVYSTSSCCFVKHLFV